MTKRTLSVVIPAYNAAADIGETLATLAAALEFAPTFTPEVILVDDGSTDGTADAALMTCEGRVPLRIISQPNRGRFLARRAGLEAATGDWVLLLDSRVTIAPEALAFVAERLETRHVWNAHVHVADCGNPFGVFWRLLAELAWADYFDDPRETSFGPEEFDRYPKGTTCFLAPRAMLLEGMNEFRTTYADLRLANDDTSLIRWIAQRERIHLAPQFRCVYKPRTSFVAFVHHATHRGVVFLDGHGHRKSRFFPAVVSFFPVSATLTVVALRRPIVAPATIMASAVAAGSFAIAKRRTPSEAWSLALAAPVYAAGHGFGMWKGLALLIRGRLAD